MSKYLFFVGFLMAECETKVFGQDISPISADRPDQTETPYTVPRKHFQMETGFLFEQTDKNTQSITSPTILFKYGLGNDFELGMVTELNAIIEEHTHLGLSPVAFRFKQKISEEEGLIPKTSFIGFLTIPCFASENLKATYFAPAFRFTMQNTLNDKFSLGYNLGAEWDGETAVPTFIYTLTSGYSITDNLGAYAELYGFVPQSSVSDHRFDCGFTYLARPNLLLDISGGFGITENAPDHYLALGISFRLKD